MRDVPALAGAESFARRLHAFAAELSDGERDLLYQLLACLAPPSLRWQWARNDEFLTEDELAILQDVESDGLE